MSVNRLQMMALSKIGSKDCYYRALKDLAAWGYLEYHPAAGPREYARVTMKELRPGHSAAPPAAVPHNPEVQDTGLPEEMAPPAGLKAGRFYKTNKPKTKNKPLPPTPGEVAAYFESRGASRAKAVKFYLHYETVGWAQGGRNAVVNWRTLADKWTDDKRAARRRFRRDQNDLDKPMDYGAPL